MAEGARLESVCGFIPTEGSNPSLSARRRQGPVAPVFVWETGGVDEPSRVRQIGRIADLDAGATRLRPQGERQGWRESIPPSPPDIPVNLLFYLDLSV